MRELIGNCTQCGKNVYCLDGFLNAVYRKNQLICFDCIDPDEQEEEKRERV